MANDASPKSSGQQKWLLIAVILIALVGGAFAFPMLSKQTTQTAEIQEQDIAEIESAISTENTPAIKTASDLPLLANMKRERILGDRSAPIKISEHSSLTCGHCGNFHKTTFDQFKAKYIDTGRAYFVFSDFPLNAPALHGSMLARCIDERLYFEFVDMLFEKQEEWAYDVSYLNKLRGYAQNYGLNEENFEACIQNQDLQDAILKRLQGNQQP